MNDGRKENIKMDELKVIKNYRNDAELRKSFNELAKKTFWIDLLLLVTSSMKRENRLA